MQKDEVDLTELQKQREESIKKENQYCELRIIIGKNDTCPYAHFESRKVTSLEHALMFKCVLEFMAGLKERDPIAYELSKRMKIRTDHIEQEIKGEDTKNES